MKPRKCGYCSIPDKKTVDRLPGGYWRENTAWYDYCGKLIDPPNIDIQDAIGCGYVVTKMEIITCLHPSRNDTWMCNRCLQMIAPFSSTTRKERNLSLTEQEFNALEIAGTKVGRRHRFWRKTLYWDAYIGDTMAEHKLDQYLEKIPETCFLEAVLSRYDTFSKNGGNVPNL